MDTMTSIVIALVVLMMMQSSKKPEKFAKKKKKKDDEVEFKKKDKVIYTDSEDEEVKATIKKVNDDGTYKIELEDDDETIKDKVSADDLKLVGGFFSSITKSFSTCLALWITAGVLFVMFIIALFI